MLVHDSAEEPEQVVEPEYSKAPKSGALPE
jgi:hypothetical protein